MAIRGILLFALVGAVMLFAAVAIALSIVCLVVLARFDRMRRRPPASRSAFIARLLRRVSRGAIRDIGDLHQAYRAFFGTAALRSSHLEELREFLQRAIHRLLSAPNRPRDHRLQAKVPLLHELVAANERALEVEQMCVPFSGTPESERKILAELLAVAAEDKGRVTGKLGALAREIRFKQDALERLSQEGERSVKLARWGWYGTLALAALTGLLGWLCLGG